jgi:hypothetical protein
MNLAPVQLDHVVVAATTLEEGVAWCEATLGVTPGPGGEHALFGTHNRLLKLNSHSAPNAYLEIIAIHPQTQPTRAPPLRRWFDLDSPALRASLAQQGPQVIHWVASVPQIDAALAAWTKLGTNGGVALTASRPTPAGLLEWQIAVRDDGMRLFDGCLPTLIQWGDAHPSRSMADKGLRLLDLQLQHPQAQALQQALKAVGMNDLKVTTGPACLLLQLEAPRGELQLSSFTG